MDSVSEKHCGIYCIDSRIENVDKYKSVSCLYCIDKVQILSFIIVYRSCVWILLFMILATLVAIEHIYIMCLETIFTKSRTTARTF